MLSETFLEGKWPLPVLGLRQITDCMALIELGYKHPQALVPFLSFKLYLGLQ